MKIIPSLLDVSYHLNGNEVIEFTDCPVCGSQNCGNIVGYVQDNPRINLLKCANCKAVSVSHKPYPEVLSTYYKEHFSKVYSLYNSTSIDVTFSGLSRFASHLEKMIPDSWLEDISRKKAISILDFGGGMVRLPWSSLNDCQVI